MAGPDVIAAAVGADAPVDGAAPVKRGDHDDDDHDDDSDHHDKDHGKDRDGGCKAGKVLIGPICIDIL